MMIKIEPIIGVKDVVASSRWYQALLNLKSSHGGDEFEMLADENNVVILCLHKWGVDEHPTLTVPGEIHGNGLILYFRVNDIVTIRDNAEKLKATIEEDIHLNQNSRKEEFSLRDLDGYFVTISL